MATTPDFGEILGRARHSAVHLEMRDSYLRDGLDDPDFPAWRDHGQTRLASPDMVAWQDLVRGLVGRGVAVRRARIFSTPATPYVRFEHAVTGGFNVAAGEQVRWLPRRDSAGIAVPTVDFWLIDDETVILNHFGGDGSWDAAAGMDVRDDPALARLCGEAFEAVWARATPHEDFKLA